MTRFLDMPVARITVTLSTDEKVTRTFGIGDPWPEWMEKPPAFLKNLRKDWPTPTQPIEFTADSLGDQWDDDVRALLAEGGNQ